MDHFDAVRVGELKQELNDLVPTGGALVEIRAIAERQSESFELRGNRLGFLRLGIECLASGRQESNTASPGDAYESLRYLGTSGHDSLLKLQRQDNIPIEKEPPAVTPEQVRRSNRRDNIVIWVLGVVVWSCVFFGVYSVVRWFVGVF